MGEDGGGDGWWDYRIDVNRKTIIKGIPSTSPYLLPPPYWLTRLRMHLHVLSNFSRKGFPWPLKK